MSQLSSGSIILLYSAILCLFAGLAWRLYVWKSTGPSTMRLAYFPKPQNGSSRVLRIAADTVFFAQMAEINPVLWLAVILFHIALFIVFIGHLHLLVPNPGLIKPYLSAHGQQIGLTAGLVWMITVLYLFSRRFFRPLKRLSRAEDYILLTVLFCIISSGIGLRLYGDISLAAFQEFARGFMTFHPQLPVAAKASTAWLFPAHLTLASAFFIYFPFSKLIHIFGTVLTNTIRRA